MAASVLPWAIGTSCGIILGNILPSIIVSALSVALYGMFLAIIIPPSKKNHTILFIVLISFIASYLCTILPGIRSLSSGTRIILLTLIIASIASIIKPIKEEDV